MLWMLSEYLIMTGRQVFPDKMVTVQEKKGSEYGNT